MAELEFEVTYDGPAIQAGRMAVRDLAPALLALGEIFTEASRLIEPDRPPVALHIRATEHGSFTADLVLHAGSIWNQLIDMFSSQTATAIANLLAVVGGAGGLFAVLKGLRGRRVITQEAVGDGQIRLTLDDGTVLEISGDTAKLLKSLTIRRRAVEVVRPLERGGIELLEFKQSGETLITINEADREAFEVPESEETLTDDERTVVLEIASVAFVHGNKWRFSEGESTFHASIEDDRFLADVEGGAEAFRSGDLLRCRLRQTQTRGGCRAEVGVPGRRGARASAGRAPAQPGRLSRLTRGRRRQQGAPGVGAPCGACGPAVVVAYAGSAFFGVMAVMIATTAPAAAVFASVPASPTLSPETQGTRGKPTRNVPRPAPIALR